MELHACVVAWLAVDSVISILTGWWHLMLANATFSIPWFLYCLYSIERREAGPLEIGVGKKIPPAAITGTRTNWIRLPARWKSATG